MLSMDTQALLDERKKTHGSFGHHARTTQRLKAVVRGEPKFDNMPPTHREALEMILHKIGRIMAGDHDFQDHWDDIAGYAIRVSEEIQGSPKMVCDDIEGYATLVSKEIQRSPKMVCDDTYCYFQATE